MIHWFLSEDNKTNNKRWLYLKAGKSVLPGIQGKKSG
jgi:hypothetical protein